MRWPYGEAPTAPIHERDIAAVAARMLCEEGHGREAYVLTGPQSLSQFEQVSIIGEVMGRSLRFEEMSPEEAHRELLTVASANHTDAAEELGSRNGPACICDIRSRRYHRNAGAEIPRLGNRSRCRV